MELCSFSFIRNEGARYIFTSSWEINATTKMTFCVSMNDFLWGSDSGCDEKRCDNGSKSIMHLSPGALTQSVRCAVFWLSRTFRVLFCCAETNGYESLLKKLWKGRFLCLGNWVEWDCASLLFFGKERTEIFNGSENWSRVAISFSERETEAHHSKPS